MITLRPLSSALLAAGLLTACSAAPRAGGGPTPVPAPPAPAPPPTPLGPPPAAFPGFDVGVYPGDAALQAWRQSSPYRWAGYYLPAPCHRDLSWAGRRAGLEAMGWGLAVVYVGQQDWAQHPGAAAQPPVDSAGATVAPPAEPAPQPACSAVHLTPARGATEGDDAITRAAAEGFAPGSVIFLDVERVEHVSPALLAYVRAWTDRLLADGRYRPGLYVHRLNAAELLAEARSAWRAAGKEGGPPLWVTAPAGFARELAPAASGVEGAAVWQGSLDTNQSWGGVTLRVDENVAERPSPSAPR